MDNLIYYLQGEPLVLFLLGLFLVSLAVIIPPLILARFFLPTKEARPKGEKKGIVKYFKTNPKASLALISIVIIIISGAFLYYHFNLSVRIVTAAQFKAEKGEAIKQLQAGRLSTSVEAGVALLDIRSREEYAKEHIKNSASSPAEKAVTLVYPIEKVDLVIYSSKASFEEARKTAEAIRKNGDSAKDKYEDEVGKTFVIKDGFEGLKNAGLITETGEWD